MSTSINNNLVEHRPQMRLIRWRSLARNSLRGFADVELPNGLRLLECPVLVSNGKAWASLPSKPQVDQDGRHKRDVNGKPAYSPIAEWRTKELRQAWSERVVALIRESHPEDLQR